MMRGFTGLPLTELDHLPGTVTELTGCSCPSCAPVLPLMKKIMAADGKNPLQLDSREPSSSFEDYAYGENRYRVLKKINPEEAARLMAKADAWTRGRFEYYRKLAALTYEK